MKRMQGEWLYIHTSIYARAGSRTDHQISTSWLLIDSYLAIYRLLDHIIERSCQYWHITNGINMDVQQRHPCLFDIHTMLNGFTIVIVWVVCNSRTGSWRVPVKVHVYCLPSLKCYGCILLCRLVWSHAFHPPGMHFHECTIYMVSHMHMGWWRGAWSRVISPPSCVFTFIYVCTITTGIF